MTLNKIEVEPLNGIRRELNIFTGEEHNKYLDLDEIKKFRGIHKRLAERLMSFGLPFGIRDDRSMWFTYGRRTYVLSYETIVCSWDSNGYTFEKHWDGFSRTTLNHVNFLYKKVTGYSVTFRKSDWETAPHGDIDPIVESIVEEVR